MKNKRQYKDSTGFVFIGLMGILVIMVLLVLSTIIPGCGEWNERVGEGLKNDPRPLTPLINYLPPSFYDSLTTQDSLELKDPDMIYYDTVEWEYMLDDDMDCGDDDSIPNYSSFTDVPAGAGDIIVVNGLVYKINEDKTQWVPVYPDENVMWIGGNGDTIWE